MKCEKCNSNQACFYYSSNINGQKTERHLCADCAREEGFGQALTGAGMFDSFSNMFSDFFAPFEKSFSSFGSFGMPFGSIIAPSFPTLLHGFAPVQTESAETSSAAIPDDAGSEIRTRRQREALKAQLEDAVKAEDFEKAITLRDKLRELEGK